MNKRAHFCRGRCFQVALAHRLKGRGHGFPSGLAANVGVTPHLIVKSDCCSSGIASLTENQALERSSTTCTLRTDTHMLKGEQIWLAELLLGCAESGNDCFPSPTTALWVNWSVLLDLSVCTTLWASIKHLLKRSWTWTINYLHCNNRVESAQHYSVRKVSITVVEKISCFTVFLCSI